MSHHPVGESKGEECCCPLQLDPAVEEGRKGEGKERS